MVRRSVPLVLGRNRVNRSAEPLHCETGPDRSQSRCQHEDLPNHLEQRPREFRRQITDELCAISVSILDCVNRFTDQTFVSIEGGHLTTNSPGNEPMTDNPLTASTHRTPRRSIIATLVVTMTVFASMFFAVTPAFAYPQFVSHSYVGDLNGDYDVTLEFKRDARFDVVEFQVSLTPLLGGSQPLPSLVVANGGADDTYSTEFTGVKAGEYGYLITQVSESGGIISTNSIITVGSQVRDLEATPLPDGRSFDIEWYRPAYGNPDKYTITVFGPFGNSTREVDGVIDNIRFEGLDLVNVDYPIRVTAHFFGGTSTTTITEKSADLPPLAPTDVSASIIDTNILTYSWTANEANDTRSLLNSVWLEVWTGGQMVYTTDHEVGQVSPERALILTGPFGLEFDTDYRIRAAAHSNGGVTFSAFSATVRTGSDPTPKPDPKPGVDITDPVINLTVPSTASRYGSTAIVNYTCTDNVAATSCIGSQASGTAVSTARIGTQTITVSAADAAGNTATQSANVTVDWNFTGQFAGTSGNEAIVARFYAATFGRLPDQGGYDYWINRLNTEPDGLAAAAQFFATSPEFTILYGDNVTDEQFVDTIYINVLGRAPEGAGRTFWIKSLGDQTHTRGSVMAFFANSAEHKTITATS